MRILFKHANVVDTQKQRIFKSDVLVFNKEIIAVKKNIKDKTAKVIDLKGKWICPGFIDGHIHIESSKLLPLELSKALIPHGTTGIVADPHEIANVVGTKGIDFMLKAAKDVPMDMFFTIPSCVPATDFDESYETLYACKLKKYTNMKQVVGLAEVMNYPAVINGEKWMLDKIKLFKKVGKVIDGHAPKVTGEQLKKYVKHGVQSDHECYTYEEALEKVKLGQWIMIRNGSVAKNLVDLLPLFDKYSHKCMIVTDDAGPLHLTTKGHLDYNIKIAVEHGKPLLKAISMVTYNPAKYFKLKDLGQIKANFKANFIIFNDLNKLDIDQVYYHGKCVYDANKKIKLPGQNPDKRKYHRIYNSIKIKPLTLKEMDVHVKGKHNTNIIQVIPGQVITKLTTRTLNFDVDNGIDPKHDILKIVVVERHKATGHVGVGYVKGFGFKDGALAATISHDSHNIIGIGSSYNDIILAMKRIKEIKGGNVVVHKHKIVAEMPLTVAGLMSEQDINTVIRQSQRVDEALKEMGVNRKLSPFMNMAFISLSVIPDLKITTNGLVDVTKFKIIKLLND